MELKYPTDYINKVICEDSLKIIKDIPNESIDLILTDPPYHLVSPSAITFVGGRTMPVKKRWGHWESKSFEKYDLLISSMIKESKRILKPNKCLIMWLRAEYGGYFARYAETLKFKIFSSLIWNKTNPCPHIRKTNYRSSFEYAIVLCNGDKSIPFNFLSQKEMMNVFHYPIGTYKITKHPTEKPLPLFHWIVKIHTDKNDLVLDPFLGSGTTAVACKELGRRFIGIEINP